MRLDIEHSLLTICVAFDGMKRSKISISAIVPNSQHNNLQNYIIGQCQSFQSLSVHNNVLRPNFDNQHLREKSM